MFEFTLRRFFAIDDATMALGTIEGMTIYRKTNSDGSQSHRRAEEAKKARFMIPSSRGRRVSDLRRGTRSIFLYLSHDSRDFTLYLTSICHESFCYNLRSDDRVKF